MRVTIGYAAGGIPSVSANILLLKNIAVAGRRAPGRVVITPSG